MQKTSWNKGKLLSAKHRLNLSISHKGKNLGNQNGFKKGQKAWNKGKMLSEKHKEKLKQAKLKNPVRYWLGKIRDKDEKACHWKGEEVKYRGLHMWVVARLGQPNTCENCGKSNLKGRKIHWANKSREYKRDLTDWLRLCAPCHGAYDRKKSYSYSIL